MVDVGTSSRQSVHDLFPFCFKYMYVSLLNSVVLPAAIPAGVGVGVGEEEIERVVEDIFGSMK